MTQGDSEKKNSTPSTHNVQPSQFSSLNALPLSKRSDQDRISPYTISITSSRQVMRIKKNINKGIIG